MSIELNPTGVACNIACTYCYEEPLRNALNINVPWDWEKARAALDKEGPFSLHGGEPLVIPLSRLEQILEYSFTRFGYSGVQTNGTLITDAHVELFKRYKTQVGISCDGPGRLSLSRWAGSEEETLKKAAKTVEAIERLLAEGLDPSIIVTLWSGNTGEEEFFDLCSWFSRLDRLGLRWANLHYLEVDSHAAANMRVETNLLLRRMLELSTLELGFDKLRFENFRQYIALLRQDDKNVHCVWHACDPLTTSAVQGIDGQGRKTNCNRTNKAGVSWTKADVAGRERQVALYYTPYEDGGCKDCRFFLMCKGECPGTGLNGDWRNRTEHCTVIKGIFEHYEQRLRCVGEMPASLHRDRSIWEKLYLSQIQESNGPHGDRPHGDKPHGDHTDAR